MKKGETTDVAQWKGSRLVMESLRFDSSSCSCVVVSLSKTKGAYKLLHWCVMGWTQFVIVWTHNDDNSLSLRSSVGRYHPAVGGDLNLGASLLATHLVLCCWEYIQHVCASLEQCATPPGRCRYVQNLMLALLLLRGDGVHAQLGRLQELEMEGDYKGWSWTNERSWLWMLLLLVRSWVTFGGRKRRTARSPNDTSASGQTRGTALHSTKYCTQIWTFY